MVAPSEKNESKIATYSFVREDAGMTQAKSSRIMADRRASETWSLVSEAVAERFDILARLAMAAAWYQALSADQTLYWLSYFCDDVTVEGVAVRRIPRSVTDALAVAGKRDCFDGYMIKANLERRQYVLIALLDDGEIVRHYPIIAWYPAATPIPDAKELAACYAEVQKNAASAREAREVEKAKYKQKVEDAKLRRELVLYHRSVYWRIQALAMAVVTTVAAFMVGRWQLCLLVPSSLLSISLGMVSIIKLTEQQTESALWAVDTILRRKRRIASVVAAGVGLAVVGFVAALL